MDGSPNGLGDRRLAAAATGVCHLQRLLPVRELAAEDEDSRLAFVKVEADLAFPVDNLAPLGLFLAHGSLHPVATWSHTEWCRGLAEVVEPFPSTGRRVEPFRRDKVADHHVAHVPV